MKKREQIYIKANVPGGFAPADSVPELVKFLPTDERFLKASARIAKEVGKQAGRAQKRSDGYLSNLAASPHPGLKLYYTKWIDESDMKDIQRGILEKYKGTHVDKDMKWPLELFQARGPLSPKEALNHQKRFEAVVGYISTPSDRGYNHSAKNRKEFGDTYVQGWTITYPYPLDIASIEHLFDNEMFLQESRIMSFDDFTLNEDK